MSHFNHYKRRQIHQRFLSRGIGGLMIVLAILASQISLAQNQSKDGAGRKFVNKIPYDVFFDNPLQVVNNNKNAATTAEASAEKPSEPKSATTETAPAATPTKSGGIAWQEILPMEELQGEVKSVRNSLTKSMANQGQFNQNFKPIAIGGAELAALAGIAQAHGEAVGWKDKAQYVRDFSAQLSQSSVNLGKENFEKTKAAFQKLSSIFEGSIPADAGDVPQTRPFSEVASRKGLMRRMEKAKDWLKQDVNSEAKFKSMGGQIQHQAAVLAALATVITTNGYEYTENDDYQQWAKSLIEGAKDAAAASKDESYDKFKQAIDKVNKSCTDCHGSYGNG